MSATCSSKKFIFPVIGNYSNGDGKLPQICKKNFNTWLRHGFPRIRELYAVAETNNCHKVNHALFTTFHDKDLMKKNYWMLYS